MKACWGVKLQLHPLLNWALDGSDWSASRLWVKILRYPLVRRPAGNQSRHGHLKKDLCKLETLLWTPEKMYSDFLQSKRFLFRTLPG